MDGTKCEAHDWAALARACGESFAFDRLRTAAAAYNVLSLVLLGVGLVVVPWLSAALAAVIGVQPWTGQLVVSPLWAAGIIAAHQGRRAQEVKVLRHARAAGRALRRYVPGALAAQLERGDDLACGAREVSVLFVDMCGFTTLAEGRAAAEIFSIVSTYTNRVSQIVRRHGGCVAGFGGDGIMAIFGAPNAVPHKERAAVEAGREIVETTMRPREAAQQPKGAPISVRVGIATGTDYVGDIAAADCAIWSAIGNTTNLAARLQSLTRQLGAAMVIDARTHAAAGDAAGGFEVHRNAAIRGRRGTEDVYTLPLPDAIDAAPACLA